MKRIIAALALLAISAAWPPTSQAQQAVTYTWTAPTTGGAVLGYTVWRNAGTGIWVSVVDSTQTRTYTYTQPAGTSHQIKVAAFNRRSVPIMSGELMVGTTTARQYGPDSPFSVPNSTDINVPGGCGRPVKQ